MDSKANTPRQLGFRMPAEWEPHAATWLAWPHNKTDWPGKFAPIPWIYAEIVRLIGQGEQVYLLVESLTEKAEATRVLERGGADLKQVVFHRVPTNRVWTRDTGPIFVRCDGGGSVKGAEVGVCDFKFNAWAKYDDWKLDDKLPSFAAKHLGLRSWKPTIEIAGAAKRMVLEGGSIDVNGQGSLLTTEECLLSDVQARNPGASKAAVESAVKDALGVDRVLWLNKGIAGDDTHGHVDDLARFVRPGTIAMAVEDNPNDANYAPLRENLERLRGLRDAKGQPFEIAELPLPRAVVFNGQRLPASYANFYIANSAVLVPVFNDPNDLRALKVLEQLFRDRPIVPVYCRDLVWGLGTLHCMTQQQPVAKT